MLEVASASGNGSLKLTMEKLGLFRHTPFVGQEHSPMSHQSAHGTLVTSAMVVTATSANKAGLKLAMLTQKTIICSNDL